MTATTLTCSASDSGVRTGWWPGWVAKGVSASSLAGSDCSARSSRSARTSSRIVVITNTIRHSSKESDCLPESLASHPGGQLPQLAGEVNHDGNHQQRERAAHQCAERTQLNPGKAERPQGDQAEPDVGQPDRQHRGDREAEAL